MSSSIRTSVLVLAALFAPSLAEAGDSCPTEMTANPFDLTPLPDLRQATAMASVLVPGPTGDRPLRHVWVLDHSGSMFRDFPAKGAPYYVTVPEFRSFVTDELGANFRDGKDSAALIAFNEYAYGWDGKFAKKIDNGSGPKFDELKVDTRADFAARLAQLPPPAYGASVAGFPAAGAQDCSRAGAGANCSKMLEGLEAARTLLDDGPGEGVIWLVTDNIYDGGKGSAQLSTAELDQNRLFYEAIKSQAEYRVVVAYPTVQGAGGAWLGSTSLFVYGIYYDRDLNHETPVEEVRRLLGDGAPGVLASSALTSKMTSYTKGENPSPGRPFRLKPLNQDVVRLSLAADVQQVSKHAEFGDKIKLKARIKIQNLLDHRRINSVTFQVKNAKWSGYEPNARGTNGKLMSAIVPWCPPDPSARKADQFLSEAVTYTNEGRGIGPNETVVVEVPLLTPPVDYSIEKASDLVQVALNDDVIMGGALQAELKDVQSEMSIAPDALRGTYGADSLPDVFKNAQVGDYVTQFVGKTKKIENPGTVMAIVVLGGIGVLAGVVGFGMFLMTSVSRRLVIDGVDKGAISIPRMRSARIERGSELLGLAKLSLGGSLTLRGANGYTARRDTEGWTLQKESGSSVRVELRSTRRR